MSKTPIISTPYKWVLGLGLIVAVLLFIFSQFYGFFKVTKDLGPSAEVRFTPFHTAGLLATSRNSKVEHFRDLKKLERSLDTVDTVLIAAKPGHINDKKFKHLKKWIKDGGHLIYWVNREEESQNDVILSEVNAVLLKDKTAEADQDLERFFKISRSVLPQFGNFGEINHKASTITINPINTDIKVSFNPIWHLADYSGNALYFTDEYAEKEHILEYPIGKGSITLMSDINFWLNPNIQKHDHGFFFINFLEPKNNKVIWFMYGGEHESALSKLKKLAMPFFWVGLLFLGLWLWRQIPRLGPQLTLNTQQRRRFSEHIRSSAQLRWQQKQQAQWLNNLQKSIHKTARLRNPSFDKLTDIEKQQWLSEITSVDPNQIAYLYQHPDSENFTESQFLELMHALQTLKNSL